VPRGWHGNDHLGTATACLDRAKQPEVTDAVEQARIGDATDGLLERIVGIRHRLAGSPVIHCPWSILGAPLTSGAATGTITV